MTRYTQFDVVRLRYGVADFGIPPSAEAEVLDVYPEGYEIEVTDDDGRLLYVGAAHDDDLEPIR